MRLRIILIYDIMVFHGGIMENYVFKQELEIYDVVIVGAGASGIGIAAMLKDFGVEEMKLELLSINGQMKCDL